MPSRVLYHCPCSTGFSPCIGPVIASSSCHPLPSLYFCEECDSIRCSLCTNNEVAIYYCPSCLFEVPAAGIKGEKSRCARNCFVCPVCTNTLAVTPSDLGGAKSHATQEHLDRQAELTGQDDWDPKSPQVSIGEPPYYLVCSACKWDSKEIGMVFEKSTGLSLQVQRHEETAMDVMEFNQLRSHFEAYLRTTNEHQPVPTASSVARSSKLLRDVPSLANDPLFSFQKRSSRAKAEAREELKAYVATSAWDAGRDHKKFYGSQQGLEEGRALGVVGRREQDRLDFLCEQEDERDISGLMQRWLSPADQSIQMSDIGPSRVPLRTKQTKRCPACRHIIVKSEPKAQSSRFKIKLMAQNYLPDIQIRLPVASGLFASGSSTTEERRRSSALLASRRREASSKPDEENLVSGRTYLFEASFLNPLDDAMTVRLHIAKHTGTSVAHGPEASQSSAASSPTKRDSSRTEWSVTPTTSSFPIGAFNEVWELDEEDNELLDSVTKGSAARKTEDSNRSAGGDDVDEMLDEFDEEMADDREHKRSRTDLGGKRERRRKGDGILKRKGHETTIGLELALGKEATGEIEFAMQVTYHYSPDGGEEQQQRTKKGDSAKSFSFWTVIRLGRLTSDAVRPRTSGLPATSTEARRSALDKRRSIMGINVSGPSATLASLREASDVKLPRDTGSLAGFDEE